MDYSQSDKKEKSYESLSEDDKEKVKQILYITDKCCIGEAAYRELTMLPGGEGLPRSYLIRQCNENLNKLCNVSRTSGQTEGVQLDFKEELENKIKEKVCI